MTGFGAASGLGFGAIFIGLGVATTGVRVGAGRRMAGMRSTTSARAAARRGTYDGAGRRSRSCKLSAVVLFGYIFLLFVFFAKV